MILLLSYFVIVMTSVREKRAQAAKEAEEHVDIHSSDDVPWYRQLYAIKDTLVIVFTPIIFLPIFLASTSRVRLKLMHYLTQL